MINRVVKSALVAGAMMMLLASSAQAAILSFDQVENGGTVTGSGAGPFVGSNIIFEYITYDLSPNRVYCGARVGTTDATVTNCLLNFSTATNTFQLVAPAGLFDASGAALPGSVANLVVLSGSFTTFGVVASTFAADGIDTKSSVLLNFYGIGTNAFTFSNSEIRTGAGGVVTEADLTNTLVVPEPGLIGLFGVGLLGVARRFSRRRAASAV